MDVGFDLIDFRDLGVIWVVVLLTSVSWDGFWCRLCHFYDLGPMWVVVLLASVNWDGFRFRFC